MASLHDDASLAMRISILRVEPTGCCDAEAELDVALAVIRRAALALTLTAFETRGSFGNLTLVTNGPLR